MDGFANCLALMKTQFLIVVIALLSTAASLIYRGVLPSSELQGSNFVTFSAVIPFVDFEDGERIITLRTETVAMNETTNFFLLQTGKDFPILKDEASGAPFCMDTLLSEHPVYIALSHQKESVSPKEVITALMSQDRKKVVRVSKFNSFHKEKPYQKFTIERVGTRDFFIRSLVFDLCLTESEYRLTLDSCREDDISQRFSFLGKHLVTADGVKVLMLGGKNLKFIPIDELSINDSTSGVTFLPAYDPEILSKCYEESIPVITERITRRLREAMDKKVLEKAVETTLTYVPFLHNIPYKFLLP